jgi:hypothetical protein
LFEQINEFLKQIKHIFVDPKDQTHDLTKGWDFFGEGNDHWDECPSDNLNAYLK